MPSSRGTAYARLAGIRQGAATSREGPSSRRSAAGLVCGRALAPGPGWPVSILRIADTFPERFAAMSAALRREAEAQPEPSRDRRLAAEPSCAECERLAYP